MKSQSLLGSALLTTLLSLLIAQAAFAGSATWNPNPTSGDWNTAANWTPNTVPNGPSDGATLDVSNTTGISISSDVQVSGITFTSASSGYNITPAGNVVLNISGSGIINQSQVMQRFSTPAREFNGQIHFFNSATAGSGTLFGVNINGNIRFLDSASAGSANMITRANYVSYCCDIGGTVEFFNNATAATASFTNNGGVNSGGPAQTHFYDHSTADHATFTNQPSAMGGLDGSEGQTIFEDETTAAHASITNNGGAFAVAGGSTIFREDASAGAATFDNKGGAVFFSENATAGDASFNNEGGSFSGKSGGAVVFGAGGNGGEGIFLNNGTVVAGGLGGLTWFSSDSAAGNGTLIANGEVDLASAGFVRFDLNSTGDTARVEVFGFGYLDIIYHDDPGVSIGSLEGDGQVFLGANNLTIGANNLSTTFSGIVQDSGSVSKIGTGTLILSNANTYIGGTTVDGGFLLVNNGVGSGTGSGTVRVNTGTLGGNGRIQSTVIIGTGSGSGAGLGPGKNSVTPGTLTIGKTLLLMPDGTYKVTLNSNEVAADKVSARGVRIRNAQITLLDLGTSVLAPGTVFTVIENTSANPILGTFSNLADGSTIVAGSNSFQANYEGGDGNDLTLTVVP